MQWRHSSVVCWGQQICTLYVDIPVTCVCHTALLNHHHFTVLTSVCVVLMKLVSVIGCHHQLSPLICVFYNLLHLIICQLWCGIMRSVLCVQHNPSCVFCAFLVFFVCLASNGALASQLVIRHKQHLSSLFQTCFSNPVTELYRLGSCTRNFFISDLIII